MRPLTRNEALLLGLLSKLDAPWTYRTKLVKLTYLLDNYSFEQTGEQLTSFSYLWDHYGPNAVSHAIVGTLDRLADDGLVAVLSYDNEHGDVSHLYAIGDIERATLPLSADDWLLIEGIAAMWGQRRLADVIDASKDTRPMRHAQQFGELRFEVEPRAEARRKELRSRYGEVLEEWSSAESDEGAGESLDSLRAGLAE